MWPDVHSGFNHNNQTHYIPIHHSDLHTLTLLHLGTLIPSLYNHVMQNCLLWPYCSNTWLFIVLQSGFCSLHFTVGLTCYYTYFTYMHINNTCRISKINGMSPNWKELNPPQWVVKLSLLSSLMLKYLHGCNYIDTSQWQGGTVTSFDP